MSREEREGDECCPSHVIMEERAAGIELEIGRWMKKF